MAKWGFDRAQVSEELNSVETCSLIYIWVVNAMFQKNLIVWKRTDDFAYLFEFLIPFQKNLIVWKLSLG